MERLLEIQRTMRAEKEKLLGGKYLKNLKKYIDNGGGSATIRLRSNNDRKFTGRSTMPLISRRKRRRRGPKHLKKKPINLKNLITSGLIDLTISVISAWIIEHLL